MQYLAMIYGEAARWEALSDDERTAVYSRYTAFAEEAGSAGVLVDGAELAATTSATTVRVRDGETLVTDGPSSRRRRRSAATSCSNAPRSTTRSTGPLAFPAPTTVRSRVRPCYVDETEEAVA